MKTIQNTFEYFIEELYNNLKRLIEINFKNFIETNSRFFIETNFRLFTDNQIFVESNISVST